MQVQPILNGIPVINNLQAAQKFAVNIDKYESITQSLYDSAGYPTTGINTLTFFQVPIGSGAGVISAAGKTPEDTNMVAAGSMPNMQAFIVTSVEVEFQPAIVFATAAGQPAVFGAGAVASSINDSWKFRATGWLNFTIGSKPYLIEGPMMKFPASNDFEINAAMSDASTAAASQQSRISFAKAVGPSYMLSPNNLLLIPMQNFVVTLNWQTLETVTSAARVFVRLMGQLLRAAQ
jgi:hypothetical protein